MITLKIYVDKRLNNMKTKFMLFGFCIFLLIIAICSGGIAQSNSVKDIDKCGRQPLGLFRQVTGASWERAAGVEEAFVIDKKSDTKDNRWTLAELDEIDPTYKFFVDQKTSKFTGAKCGDTIEVVGKLIAPTGKLFDFKRAIYDKISLKLKFTTVERDGVTYDVEVQFYDRSVFVDGTYQVGIVKLKASSKTLGTVLMEFPFTSWNSE